MMEKKKVLTTRQERFIKEMASPNIKSATEAAIKAGYSAENARIIASENLTKLNITAEIEKRKKQLAALAGVDKAQIIGAAARSAFASIDDALDESGHFDIDKARRTGAIHLVKKLTRVHTRYGENVSVEFYSASEARQELADYFGVKQQPRENEQKLANTVRAVVDWLTDYPQQRERLDDVIRDFSRGRVVDEGELRALVLEQLERVQ